MPRPVVSPVFFLVIFERAIFRINRRPAIRFVHVAANSASDQTADNHAGRGGEGASGAVSELIADNPARDSADDRPAFLMTASRTAARERQKQRRGRQIPYDLHVFPVE